MRPKKNKFYLLTTLIVFSCWFASIDYGYTIPWIQPSWFYLAQGLFFFFILFFGVYFSYFFKYRNGQTGVEYAEASLVHSEKAKWTRKLIHVKFVIGVVFIASVLSVFLDKQTAIMASIFSSTPVSDSFVVTGLNSNGTRYKKTLNIYIVNPISNSVYLMKIRPRDFLGVFDRKIINSRICINGTSGVFGVVVQDVKYC